MDSETQDNFLRIYRNDYSEEGYFLEENYNYDQMYYIVHKSGYEFSDKKEMILKIFRIFFVGKK